MHMDGSIVFARWHQCAPHLIHGSFGPPKSRVYNPNSISTGSAVLAPLMTDGHCTAATSPRNYPSNGGSGPHLKHGSLGHPSPYAKWHLDLDWFRRSAIFARLAIMTDRQRDWPHFSNRNNMPHLHIYTINHKKRSQLIFLCNFVKNQRILMQSSLLELTMNDTCDGTNITHLA